MAKQLEESELGDDANIGVEEKGVVVSFKANAFFKADSAKLNAKATNELKRFSNLIFLLPNNIQIEGHTKINHQKTGIQRGNWEALVLQELPDFFIENGLDPTKITVKSFGSTRPRFLETSPTPRSLNNRVEVIVLPE